MDTDVPYPNWKDLEHAPRSAFFHGQTADTVFDRTRNAYLTPSGEALFTHSNARVLLGHAANGSLRLAALPTQVYPAPTGMGEFGLGPGMYHHFDVAMYVGDLSYQIALEGEADIDLAADALENETFYADHFLPVTVSTAHPGLEIRLVSLAPVAPEAERAPLAPAPLPGPAGALYVLWVRNRGERRLEGKVRLRAGDLLVGNYEDASPQRRDLVRPSVFFRQNTLILSRPEGAVGVHLHQGRWQENPEHRATEGAFLSERAFRLDPGQEATFETYLGLGASYAYVMPVIYDLYRRPALDWLNLTAAFWRSRLGNLEVDGEEPGEVGEAARMSRDVYIRCLFDNFNCLQTGLDGSLIAHWQGAPSHGYGTVWGIDVEPTAGSIACLVPEITRQTMIFFMTRSRAPRGPIDHSTPILVAPVILARLWLQVTGDSGFLQQHPEILDHLLGIMADLEAMQSPIEALFPSRYSSDGPVGRRYDYGTNVKVYYTFDSMAYILRLVGQAAGAARYSQTAIRIREAIARTMVVDGPFGRQVSGGTNLGEDPGHFYSPEDLLYYDGEDTSSVLAPIYGACDFDDEAWVNYHRFARSLWSHHYDPEFDTLRWSPAEPGVVDGTALFSRLGGAFTRKEMLEAFETLRDVGIDEATGSVFWWPHGRQYKRSLTRCSQGQGAWAWQYLYQWLGLTVDANERRLVVAPRGLLTSLVWTGFRAGPNTFDIEWKESDTGAALRVKNHNDAPWTVEAGFRGAGAGAGGPLSWQRFILEPGAEITVAQTTGARDETLSLDRAAVTALEVKAMGEDGILFRRFGAALLWGHWDLSKAWDITAMPLALRFVVANTTGQDWEAVRVELDVPEPWRAQGRQPRDWARTDRLESGTIRLDLGRLPSGQRTTAPFWLEGPEGTKPTGLWDDAHPFHVPTQPGNEINLWVERDFEEDVVIEARLRARAAGGEEITRELTVPIRLHPQRAAA